MDRISLGRWFGVPVFLDPFAIFILAFFTIRDTNGGAMGIVSGALFGVGVLLSILVHELGHAVSAKAFKLAPQEIVLHGFGGWTRYGYAPRPWPGIFTTLAGPLAGLALGVALLFVPGDNGTLSDLANFNLFWSIVNLLPIYPLDGGKILAHVFSLFMGEGTAHTWAARIGIPAWVAIGAWAVFAGQWIFLVIVLNSLQSIVPVALGTPPPRRRR